MIKGVIFDMDGLMIDSEIETYRGYKKILESYGYDLSLEFFKTLLGNNMVTVKNKFIEHFSDDLPIDTIVSELHQYLHDTFEQNGVPLKKGLIELLSYLKENNYKTIVATGSSRPRVLHILNKANISHLFDDCICGDEVSVGKPNPETFIKACDKLGLNHDEVIVLEDSEAGILAAYNGNMKVICIPDMLQHPPHVYKKAIGVYNSLDEVIDYFKSL